MLQEIAPNIFYNHYYPDAVADDNSRIVIMRGEMRDREVLICVDEKDNTASFPVLSEFEGLDLQRLIYLFRIDDEQFFLYLDDETGRIDNCLSGGCSFWKMTDLRRAGLEPERYIFAVYTAFHLYEWYSTTRFCGKCGCRNTNDTIERARVCTGCGNKTYPRINPAVIIGVTDRESNRIILTRYRSGFSQNALVAGFTEIGETLEETVKREVMEEVGLEVDNIRYYASQPWGIASDILSGFYCDVVGDKDIKMDTSELKYAEWVSPGDIILQNPDYSLTNEMMRVFKEHGYDGTK